MNSAELQPATAAERVNEAFAADDARCVCRLLNEHPELKKLINEPIGPFASPAIVNVRSREMLEALLDAGADLNAKSNWWAGGFGLLHLAEPDLAMYAIERGAVVDVHAAARLGLMDRLRELVDGDLELVHARGGDGQTPLHFAKTVEVAALLLDRGAIIDERDIDHESTPAQYMVKDRQDVVRFLIQRGCQTDLLMAAAVGDVDLARRHLDADPECVRIRVGDDYFPMIGQKSGGTIYQWTLGFHVTAHQVARNFGHDDILQLLIERSPPTVLLMDACWRGDAAAARKIETEHPRIIDELSDSDCQQIAHAARNNETAVVRLMAECGFPIDAPGQHRATPLHWAAFHGNAEMAKELLRFRPLLEATDADFQGTPLGWVIHGSENGWHAKTGDYTTTVALLLEAGSKPPAKVGGTNAVQEVLRRFAQK